MKKSLYLSFFSLNALCAIAQPTIHHSGVYSIGSSFKTIYCDETNVAPGNAGANQTWHFNTLVTIDSEQTTTVLPSSTPYASLFPTASFAFDYGGGNYEYYSNAGGEVNLLGYASTMDTIIYTNAYLRAKNPFTFNNTANDTYVATSSFYNGTGTVAVAADGYGSLHLPNGLFSNVLRIKVTVNETGTLQGAGAYTLKDFQYLWYDDIHSTPLLLWDSTIINSLLLKDTFKTVTYLGKESGTAGISEKFSQKMNFTASINNTGLLIKGDFEENKNYDITLISMNGQTVLETKQKGSKPMTITSSQDIAHGMYLLAVRESDNPQSFSIIKLTKE